MTIREAALRQAITFIGVTEKPPGSNRGPQIDQWNKDACGVVGVSWCCSFMHGMFKRVGFLLPGGASVGNLLAAARSAGWLVPSTKKGQRPLRGDLACFELGEGAYDYGDHIGIVERVLALRYSGGKFTGWIQTIEGNTSSNAAGSQSNGICVDRKRRWMRGISAEFVRVPGNQAVKT